MSNLAVLDSLMATFPWKLQHLRNCGHVWMAPGGHQTPWCVEGNGFGAHSFRFYGPTPDQVVETAIQHLRGQDVPGALRSPK